ncbi:MAG: hypothetical protein R2789_18730 [Microthrixaceae bacterium]
MDLLTILQLHGAAAGDEAIELSDYVTGGVMDATAVLDTGCVDEIVNSMAPVFGSSPFVEDPWETEPARSVLEDNKVGSVIVPEVPLMIVSGGADTTLCFPRGWTRWSNCSVRTPDSSAARFSPTPTTVRWWFWPQERSQGSSTRRSRV